jgi:hypothetical protein
MRQRTPLCSKLERMPYESARDLPSFVEMLQQVRSIKLLRFALPRNERQIARQLETQLHFLGDTVDRFYDALGPRNWIFHDSMSVQEIADLLEASTSPDEAERKLIDYYKSPETLQFMIPGLNIFEALRKRKHLVRRAQDDYLAGRYYACIHVLLSVMDGFVNEFESVRKGLHTRKAEELDARDSVVGHHLGLTRAHATFTRRKGATSDEPIYELYRHGIVHGTILNYDNDVVATKAWNRLFAVADWAKAKVKEQQPPKHEPTWRELFAQLADNARKERANKEWRPETVVPSDSSFETQPARVFCEQLLAYWRDQNYGRLATLVSKDIRDAYGRDMPRQVRNEYSSYSLASWELLKIDCSAPSVCLVEARLTLKTGDQKRAGLRLIYEDEAGEYVASSLPGAWRLMLWGPAAFLDEP